MTATSMEVVLACVQRDLPHYNAAMTRETPSVVQSLMGGLIDYAGLFPPARLPLADALRNYAEYRGGPEAWILGRFLCPTPLLKELVDNRHLMSPPLPWPISVIGGGGDDGETFLQSLSADLKAIQSCLESARGFLIVDALELKVPPAVVSHPDAARFEAMLERACERLAPQGLTPYFEIPLQGEWRTHLDRAISAVGRRNQDNTSADLRIGLKIRMGGVEAHQFPSVEQVAYWVEQCARFDIPFKATAGLHHPIRHQSPEVQATIHGFLNLFLAAVLAYQNRRASPMPLDDLTAMLADESTESFSVQDGKIRWRSHRFELEVIGSARNHFARSYGSCSFVEPIADLKAMGWLAATP